MNSIPKMLAVLNVFRNDVNSNVQIQRIVKDWNTAICLEESNNGAFYSVPVKGGKIGPIFAITAEEASSCALTISGNGDVIRGVFEGTVNGIRANNEGLIAIYGSISDQVKLDAIALILWGI